MSRQGGGKKEKKVEERTSGEVDREGDDSIDKEKMEKGRERERKRGAIRRQPEHRYPSK